MSDTDDSSVPFITQRKILGIYPHIMKVSNILENELSTKEVDELRSKPYLRGKLIEELATRQLLRPSVAGRIENLPVIIFLMKELTKSEYLTAVQKGNYPTGQYAHIAIMKCSIINDAETAESVKLYSNGEMNGKELKEQLDRISKGIDTDINNENGRPVSDVLYVKSMDDVPDGANFISFENMPNLDIIRKKKVNLAVLKPSQRAVRQIAIIVEEFIHGTASESTYAGRMGTVPYMVFGPRVVIPDATIKIPTAASASSLFCFAFNENKRKLREEIYTLVDYF